MARVGAAAVMQEQAATGVAGVVDMEVVGVHMEGVGTEVGRMGVEEVEDLVAGEIGPSLTSPISRTTT